MNTRTLMGAILIVLGAVGLIYGGINYYSRKNVVDFGELRVQVEEQGRIPVPPIAGAAALLAGVFLVVGGKRRGAT